MSVLNRFILAIPEPDEPAPKPKPKPVTAESVVESVKELARLFEEPTPKPKTKKSNMTTPVRLSHEEYFEVRTKLDPTAPGCFANTDRELAEMYSLELGFPISQSSIKDIRKNGHGIDDPPRKTTNGARLERLEMALNYLADSLSEGGGGFGALEIDRLKQILKGENATN